MKLYIDTRSRENIIISAIRDGKMLFVERSTVADMTPELALEIISRALEDAAISVNDIKELSVEKGPGSYTGIRVGVSVANSLSFALGVSVNDHRISDITVPEY